MSEATQKNKVVKVGRDEVTTETRLENLRFDSGYTWSHDWRPLTKTALKGLYEAGLETVGDLAKVSKGALRRLVGIGDESVHKLMRAAKAANVELLPDPVPVQIEFEPTLYRELHQYAREQGRPVAKMLQEALSATLPETLIDHIRAETARVMKEKAEALLAEAEKLRSRAAELESSELPAAA